MPRGEIGQVKLLILAGLILVLVFNLPYKLSIREEMHLFETGINSLTETFMLFINLALSHGMYASDTSLKKFYVPKALLCLLVFLGLWAWSYADALEFHAFLQKDFVVDEAAQNFERGCFTFFLLVLIVYVIVAAYYSVKALKAKSIRASGYNRFQSVASGLILIISGCTVSLLVFPFESQTLQFMNEHGVVNIYLIVLSYMLAPNTQIDEDIIVDEDGNVAIVQAQGSPPSKDYTGVGYREGSEETLKTEEEVEMKDINTFNDY